MRRRRVLHVVPTYYPATYWGGPIFSVYALNRALVQQGDVELRVLTTDAAGPLVRDRLIPQATGIYDHDVTMTRRVGGASVSPGLLARLGSLVRWAEVVHLTATYSFPTLPTLVACRAAGKPMVWSPRGAIQDAVEWDGSRNRRFKGWWDGVCNQLADPRSVVVHVTSEREREATRSHLTRLRAEIIANGVEVPPPATRSWQPAGQTRLLYMGRLAPKKGIERLIEAVASCAASVNLRIYGRGDPAYTAGLHRAARERGVLGTRVVFAGEVTDLDKTRAFHEADLCVVPSFTENFCMVVAESLAHGVPVIASHGTPWARVAEVGCGEWVANDPGTLREAIERMRCANLGELGARGRAWMEREYSWAAAGRAMRSVYESIA